MKNILNLLIIVIGLGLTSCDKFLNGLVLEIEVPEHEPVIVPYCFINAQDTVIKVFVQQSQGILDSANLRYIDNATVELYKNGVLWKELSTRVIDPFTGEISYEVELEQPIANEGYGDSYELRVSAPDFETVTATQTMPAPKAATEIQHLRDAANNFGDIINNTRVTFDDTPDEENYYQIVLEVFEFGTISSGDTVYEGRSTTGGQTIINTESISDGYNGVVITDVLFDGQSFTADVGSYANSSSSTTTDEPITYSGIVHLKLFSISRDEYLYQKSLNSYSFAQSNPLAEPTLIHSNVSGGLGMFSMHSNTDETFEF